MPDLIREHAVLPFIERLPLAATRDEVLENRTGCLDLLANSILWDTFGMQRGRNGHWLYFEEVRDEALSKRGLQ